MSRQSELAELSRVYDTSALSNRNLVINGAMNVAQRGTSATSSGYSTVDRFVCTFSGHDEAPTIAQHTLTSSDTEVYEKGFRNSFHITNGNQTSGAGSADRVFIQHRIEAQDIAKSGWDYTSSSSNITLSFYCKSSVAQNFYGRLETKDGTQQNYAFETGSLAADTWTKITKTISGNSNISIDDNNDIGLTIEIIMFRGTDTTDSSVSLNAWNTYSSSARTPDSTSTWYTTDNATFEITGVQLEVGDTATPFEHRSYGDELMRCFRYFIRRNSPQDGYPALIAGFHSTSGYFNGVTQFEVEMRATPSLTTSGAFRGQGFADSSSATGTCTIQNASSESCRLNCSGMSFSGTNGQYVHLQQTGGAGHVSFDAEL